MVYGNILTQLFFKKLKIDKTLKYVGRVGGIYKIDVDSLF
jgi:hypothetical protein